MLILSLFLCDFFFFSLCTYDFFFVFSSFPSPAPPPVLTGPLSHLPLFAAGYSSRVPMPSNP